MWKVLCIDDDKVLTNALRETLRRSEIELISFESIKDFAQAPHKAAFDLVLIDLDMADHDGVVWKFAGLHAVKSVRTQCGPDTPIYVFSGHTNNYVIGSTKLNGANGYLQKTGSLTELSDLIVELLMSLTGQDVAQIDAEIA